MNKGDAKRGALLGLTVAQAQAIMEPWSGRCAGWSRVNPQFTKAQIFDILWPHAEDYPRGLDTSLSLPAAVNILWEFA